MPPVTTYLHRSRFGTFEIECREQVALWPLKFSTFLLARRPGVTAAFFFNTRALSGMTREEVADKALKLVRREIDNGEVQGNGVRVFTSAKKSFVEETSPKLKAKLEKIAHLYYKELAVNPLTFDR